MGLIEAMAGVVPQGEPTLVIQCAAMTNLPSDQVLGPRRRSALSGLVGVAGAALLATGCSTTEAVSGRPRASGTASSSAGGPAPGVMSLFDDPEFEFNGLLALGLVVTVAAR